MRLSRLALFGTHSRLALTVVPWELEHASWGASLEVPMSVMLSLFQSIVPRFARLEYYSTLFLGYSLKTPSGERFQRTPVLLIGTSKNIVILSPAKKDLAE
ncbi:MAG: hypothetical protein ACI8Z1_000997 [Candidatus Azotimanducaceae bacterium]